MPLKFLKFLTLILCEDTRVSKKLLDKHNIKNKRLLHITNLMKKNLSKAIQLLENKKIVSIISDAGTPCISDPGNILIK